MKKAEVVIEIDGLQTKHLIKRIKRIVPYHIGKIVIHSVFMAPYDGGFVTGIKFTMYYIGQPNTLTFTASHSDADLYEWFLDKEGTGREYENWAKNTIVELLDKCPQIH